MDNAKLYTVISVGYAIFLMSLAVVEVCRRFSIMSLLDRNEFWDDYYFPGF